MNGKSDSAKALLDMLMGAVEEVEQEQRAAMSPEEVKLDAIAREILRLERDMTIPGSSATDSVRAERLMNFIESKDF